MSDRPYQELNYSLYQSSGELSGTELLRCAHVVADPNAKILASRSFHRSDKAVFGVMRTTAPTALARMPVSIRQ